MSMNLNNAASGGGTDIPKLALGAHPSVLVGIIDTGQQPGDVYKGKQKKPYRKIVFMFEMPGQTVEIGGVQKPRTYSVNCNYVKGGKLEKIVSALDPQNVHQGDITKLLGTPCLVNIVMKEDNTDVCFGSCTGLPVGFPPPQATLPLQLFELSNPDVEMFKTFPTWIREMILNGLDFRGSAADAPLSAAEAELASAEQTQQQAPVQQAPVQAAPVQQAAPPPWPQAQAPVNNAPPVAQAPAPAGQAAPPGYQWDANGNLVPVTAAGGAI